MKTKVIVTGGAGFVGSHIVDALIAEGYNVHVIDNLATGSKKNLHPNAIFHKADIRNLKSIAPFFTGARYVFHTAALARIQPSILNPRESNEVNITGTLNVLLAARDAKVKKVMYSASSSAYGSQPMLPYREDMVPHPQNPYALQKLTGELYCRLFSELYGLPTVSLRYFNVYGPRQKTDGAYATVIGIFLRQRMAGEPLTVVKDGRIKRRDYTYVSDIVRGNMLAMKSNKVGKGEVLNLGAGKNYSVVEVARMVGGPHVFIPVRLGEAKETLADYSKARRLLGWKPLVRFKDGLEALKKECGIV